MISGSYVNNPVIAFISLPIYYMCKKKNGMGLIWGNPIGITWKIGIVGMIDDAKWGVELEAITEAVWWEAKTLELKPEPINDISLREEMKLSNWSHWFYEIGHCGTFCNDEAIEGFTYDREIVSGEKFWTSKQAFLPE